MTVFLIFTFIFNVFLMFILCLYGHCVFNIFLIFKLCSVLTYFYGSWLFKVTHIFNGFALNSTVLTNFTKFSTKSVFLSLLSGFFTSFCFSVKCFRLDRAATENKKFFPLGDYNLNYFNCNERNLLATLILPYGLLNSNKTLATRETSRTKSLIDYVICENFF